MIVFELGMPSVRDEAEATVTPTPTLGRQRDIASRVTVGVSDVVPLTEHEAKELSRDPNPLTRVTMRVSFRPAPNEYFERVLFSVLLQPANSEASTGAASPIAYALTPKRLESGPYTISNKLSAVFGVALPPISAGAASASSSEAELRPPYVVAAGEGESDPEWRYQRTETMALEGSHEMGMIVELPDRAPAEAFISIVGAVVVNHQSVEVAWTLDDNTARVSLA